jgi:thiol-disulfide isomerase/thioredoxin
MISMLPLTSRAPEFPSAAQWLNTDNNLSLAELKGHLIVLDFWTYCCINCIRTIPVLQSLEQKYRDKPVIFIGVHTAKFENERDRRGVRAAVQRYEIAHPVFIDRDRSVWDAYGVRGWPTIIIIDYNGRIVYKESGEGQRDEIDRVLAHLLTKAQKSGELVITKKAITAPLVPHKQKLSFPGKLAYDAVNKCLFIADSNHNRILVTRLGRNRATVIHEIGSGKAGLADGTFARARFDHPQGMVVDGNMLYVADTNSHAIRAVDVEQKRVETCAKELASPWDLTLHDTTLYIAMAGSHQLWCMDMEVGKLQPYAGTGAEQLVDGNRERAVLAQPSGLTTDGYNLYFADSEASALRRVHLESGDVETLIGKGLFVFGNNDGSFADALLQHPLGVCYYHGNVYLADTYNHAIKVANIADKTVTTLIGTKTGNKTVCTIKKKGMVSCDELPLFEPNDVIALEDKLIIADTNNHLIRIFDTKKRKLRDVELIF